MGHLPPKSIAEMLHGIRSNEYVLPAIQREYVWRPSQVVRLFDSILRGYPIGSFLAWRIKPETVAQFKFYGFMKDYSQFDNRHSPDLDLPEQEVTAILDGQQRLTSLNIGLRGTYAVREPRKHAKNPGAYPVRRLYLNTLGEAAPNDDGLRYDFRLLTERQIAEFRDDEARFWFPVSKVFDSRTPFDLVAELADVGLGNNKQALDMLGQLHQAIHAKESVHIYEETEQDVDRVLDIFIRVNSGGTVLSYSDLLLSIATAQWKNRDARDAIHGLVDMINDTGMGFSFSQDVVLKAGLMLAGIGDIGFKVKNFTAENMAVLDREWDAISDSLKLAVGLLSDFGLSDSTLSAKSVVIPVAYYVHARGLTESYRLAVSDAGDRELLRSWVLRSLIVRGVWGSGLDTLLRELRQVIQKHGKDGFPAEEVERAMARSGKSLAITDEMLDDVLDLSYGGGRTFAVMAMLFDHIDTRNVFHVDHIFPRTLLETKELKQQGLSSDEIEDLQSRRDRLPNLQLLQGNENMSKSGSRPDVWAAEMYPTFDALASYLALNELTSLPHEARDFSAFFDKRREMLASRIRRKFPAPPVIEGVVGDAPEVVGGIELDSSADD